MSKASIKTVQVGDNFISLTSKIGHHVVSYYKDLFAKANHTSQDFSILRDFSWNTIWEEQNSLLTATPSLDEIRDAVLGLDASSSPGPDGFGGYFYHKCWGTISDDVSVAITHIFVTLDILEGMNSSFVTLIPKVGSRIFGP